MRNFASFLLLTLLFACTPVKEEKTLGELSGQAYEIGWQHGYEAGYEAAKAGRAKQVFNDSIHTNRRLRPLKTIIE